MIIEWFRNLFRSKEVVTKTPEPADTPKIGDKLIRNNKFEDRRPPVRSNYRCKPYNPIPEPRTSGSMDDILDPSNPLNPMYMGHMIHQSVPEINKRDTPHHGYDAPDHDRSSISDHHTHDYGSSHTHDYGSSHTHDYGSSHSDTSSYDSGSSYSDTSSYSSD